MSSEKKNKKQTRLTEKSREKMEKNIAVIKHSLKGKPINEDILQEIYLALCHKMMRYDSTRSRITTFLHLHSNWSALDTFNRSNNKKNIKTVAIPDNFDMGDEKDDPIRLLLIKEQEEIIRKNIDELPIVAKIILGYFTFFDHNINQVCKELKLTRNIVHQQLNLSYELLRDSLKSYFFDE